MIPNDYRGIGSGDASVSIVSARRRFSRFEHEECLCIPRLFVTTAPDH